MLSAFSLVAAAMTILLIRETKGGKSLEQASQQSTIAS